MIGAGARLRNRVGGGVLAKKQPCRKSQWIAIPCIQGVGGEKRSTTETRNEVWNRKKRKETRRKRALSCSARANATCLKPAAGVWPCAQLAATGQGHLMLYHQSNATPKFIVTLALDARDRRQGPQGEPSTSYKPTLLRRCCEFGFSTYILCNVRCLMWLGWRTNLCMLGGWQFHRWAKLGKIAPPPGGLYDTKR